MAGYRDKFNIEDEAILHDRFGLLQSHPSRPDLEKGAATLLLFYALYCGLELVPILMLSCISGAFTLE